MRVRLSCQDGFDFAEDPDFLLGHFGGSVCDLVGFF